MHTQAHERERECVCVCRVHVYVQGVEVIATYLCSILITIPGLKVEVDMGHSSLSFNSLIGSGLVRHIYATRLLL